MGRLGTSARAAGIAMALACCGALGYLAAGASSAAARGETNSCGYSAVSYCVQWNVDGGATKLTVQNTGNLSGLGTIHSFTFALPGGASAYGVGGNSGCTNGPDSNEISCGSVAPGQTSTVDILSSSISLGSGGTFTATDGNGVAQPPLTVPLDAAAGTTSTTTTTGTTATTGTTTTPTTTTAQTTTDTGDEADVAARLHVRPGLLKLQPKHDDYALIFTVTITNNGPDAAYGVEAVVTFAKANGNFTPAAGGFVAVGLRQQWTTSRSKLSARRPCAGKPDPAGGREFRHAPVRIECVMGTLPPHAVRSFTVDGTLIALSAADAAKLVRVGPIRGRVVASAGTPDPNVPNNAAEVEILLKKG